MKDSLQVFGFDGHPVRVVTINDALWFVAKDVAQCLGLAHHRDATRKLDDDEKDDVEIIDAIGRLQKTTVVNESGVYTMMLRCDGATTPGTVPHRFRKFITSEVLPSIRKTGSYTAPTRHADIGDVVEEMFRREGARKAESQDNEMIGLQRELLQMYREREVLLRPQPKPIRNAPTELTADEIAQITLKLAQGLSQAQIARDLGRSAGTVSKYVLMIRGR